MLITSNRPLALSIAVHVLLAIVLLFGAYLERPHLVVKQASAAEVQPVIKASIVDNKAVAKAIARQEQAEKKKQLQLAEEKQQAEKLKQEVKKAKELTEKLKAEAETARVLAKEELAKASKIQQQVAEAKQQAEKIKQQAEKDQKLADQAKQQAATAKQQIAKAETARIAEQQSKSQAAEEQLRAEKRQRWLNSEFDRFVVAMTERVYNNRTLSSTFQENLVCKIQIQLMPDGSVNMVKVVGSSGNAAYDSMAEAAVYKSAPFEMPADNDLVSRLRDIIFEFKDEDYMS